MDLTFAGALRQLGADAAFRIINTARPPANYVLARFLPERLSPSYDVQAGSMTVRATMAGLAGMDSPYPEGGTVEISTFLQQSAKLAHAVDLPERALRSIQDLVMRQQLAGGNAPQTMVEQVLNFTQKLLVQPQLDAMEWLRGQALATGAIDWTFNQKRLQVDYGVPVANKLPRRTGTAAYSGTASAFWADVAALQKLLRYDVQALLVHPDLLNAILSNAANNIEVLSQANSTFRIRRYVQRAGTTVASSDARETIDLISYGAEGEVLDTANPGQTLRRPFLPVGPLVAVGTGQPGGYVVGAGGTEPDTGALGYTHLAPTIEGNGVPGRWARVYTPEHRPWALRGETAANALPVLEFPTSLAIASSDL